MNLVIRELVNGLRKKGEDVVNKIIEDKINSLVDQATNVYNTAIIEASNLMIAQYYKKTNKYIKGVKNVNSIDDAWPIVQDTRILEVVSPNLVKSIHNAEEIYNKTVPTIMKLYKSAMETKKKLEEEAREMEQKNNAVEAISPVPLPTTKVLIVSSSPGSPVAITPSI